MRIAEAILRHLKMYGVEYVFGIPAGTVSPIFDAMNDVDIRPIITKNEAGSAYMAARYASVTGKLGVCIGAGGVGACNMINGVADAMRAKAPMVVITGYIHRAYIGKGALQELDTKDIFKPITKYSKTVMNVTKVFSELEHAIKLSLTYPRGPVHISIPIDIQLAKATRETSRRGNHIEKRQAELDTIMRAAEIINSEKYGIIMAGKGTRGLSKKITELSEHLQWPIVTTPEGKGVISAEFPLNLGNFGYAGTDAATEYIEHGPATCLLVLGSSLGECSTGNFSKDLVNGRRIIHVDIDPKELGKVFDTEVKINDDLKDVIPQLINRTNKNNIKFVRPKEINKPYVRNHTGLSIRQFLERITGILPSNTYYVCDLGEYMNFVFKFLELPEGGDFEINLNHAAMGSGIAGAIGVQMAYITRPVAVFAGDGSFFMNGSEILTAKEYNLPVIYIIVNNAMLGYVEHGHQFLFGRVLEGFKSERISISAMMAAVGVKSVQIHNIEDLQQIKALVADLDGPCVIELVTDGSEEAPIMDRLKALKKK